MKEQFTPGPWKNTIPKDDDGLSGYSVKVTGAKGLPEICTVKISSVNTMIEQRKTANRANSNLIAAAPDMYEALRIIDSCGIFDKDDGSVFIRMTNEEFVLIKSALLKANPV